MMILKAAIEIVSQKPEPVSTNERRMFVIFAISATIVGLLIAFDGRYRDIPVIPFLIPVFGSTLLVVLSKNYADFNWKYGVTAILIFTALANIGGEGWAIVGEDFSKTHPTKNEQIPLIIKAMFSNIEVLVWVAMLLIWAWSSNIRYRIKES